MAYAITTSPNYIKIVKSGNTIAAAKNHGAYVSDNVLDAISFEVGNKVFDIAYRDIASINAVSNPSSVNVVLNEYSTSIAG